MTGKIKYDLENDTFEMLTETQVNDLKIKKNIFYTCALCNRKPMKRLEVSIVVERTGQRFWAHEKCMKKILTRKLRSDWVD